MLVRQPTEGRSRGGGLKFGEMEKDAIVVHGCSRFLKERLFNVSDEYSVPVCHKCGIITTRKKTCESCGNDETVNVDLPYSTKLLFSELNAMGIKTKINTL
jgi:DNA-directed RNA polymerase II subunit RPB2